MRIAPSEEPIPWHVIDNVLLDMDGTLLDLNFDNHVWNIELHRRIAKRDNLTLKAAQALVAAKLATANGQLQWYCFDHWSAEFGIDISAIEAYLEHLIKPRPAAIDFLTELKASHHVLSLVTNAHRRSLKRKITKTSIDQYFDHVISAHDLGAAKEQSDFWTSLSERIPFDRDRTLLIDDNCDVLNAAQKFGIRHLRAVRQPNMSKPEQPTDGFLSINSFYGLAPPRLVHGIEKK